jgi:hypothetical protein
VRIGQGASFGGWPPRVPWLTTLDNPQPPQHVHEAPHMPLLAEIGGFAGVEANACPSGRTGELPGPARCVPYLDTNGRAPLHRIEGDSPDTRRRLAVVPLIRDKRYYGETPVRLRRGSREGQLEGWRNRRPMAPRFGAPKLGAPRRDLAIQTKLAVGGQSTSFPCLGQFGKWATYLLSDHHSGRWQDAHSCDQAASSCCQAQESLR